jgi:hypothetical protein
MRLARPQQKKRDMRRADLRPLRDLASAGKGHLPGTQAGARGVASRESPAMSLLADRLGADHEAELIASAGGERLVIPENLAGDEPRALERRFGRELAVLLVLHFGGRLVYVPTGNAALRQAGSPLKVVVRMTKAGKSANEIARRLELSDRAVYYHRARAKRLGLLPASE